MLWESDSDNKENPDETGRGPGQPPLHTPVTPVLLPAQSGTKSFHEAVPVVVPDVEELKEQFQQQQNMLAQIKETIKENESQLSSKGKQVEAYANRLSQIRARSKKPDAKINVVAKRTANSPVKTLTKKPSKENLANECDSPGKNKTAQSNVKLSPKAKYIELKKKLQESKMKFEERAGKEVSETKKIESIVENLRMQLEERDVTIQELQKIAEQPAMSNVKLDASLRKLKSKTEGRIIASKSTQTIRLEQNDESIEIIGLQNRIHELEANILDLEESLKEKESVIDARTQAVTLLSQDLSIKGKNTLECLEETRQEMRSMQNNFIIIENQLKKELVEKDEELTSAEEKLKKLETVNAELNTKNLELLEKLAGVEKKYADLESDKKFLNESVVRVQNDDKVAELSNKISILNKELDDSNKSMIKMKLEHKNKIKSLNKMIEKLKETSDDKAEILRLQTLVNEFEVVKESLQNKIAELEEEKGNLLLSILDVDDFKVTEKKLKDTINELETQVQQQAIVIENHLQTISNMEKEKFDMFQSAQDQNILIENLYAKIQNLESESVGKDSRMKALQDEHKIKLESLKFERSKEVEGSGSYYGMEIGVGDRKESEECRITTELNNVQVEEQIEMLIREKQQLLDKLKSLSGVSSTESFTFETVEHLELQDQAGSKAYNTETAVFCGVGDTANDDEARNQDLRLQRVIDEQQTIINDLQNVIKTEKENVLEYQQKLAKLEEDFKNLEQVNNQLKHERIDESEGSKTPKSNVNVKNKIKKIQTELMESRKTIQLQNEKLEELNMKLDEKEQLIKNYIEKIELFEKDDWGRENDWKVTQDEFEHMQELQKKCLSLENSLIELTEDCERLRKENIEVVHLLSEEKVKRKKLMEQLHLEDYGSLTSLELNESRLDLLEEGAENLGKEEWPTSSLEERVMRLIEAAEALENRLRVLEVEQSHPYQVDHSETITNSELMVKELQEKLEWSNIVLTSKETEIFKLQSLLEDNAKTVEDLERNLKETSEKLGDQMGKYNYILGELNIRDRQLHEVTANYMNLQESLNFESERTFSNESQLRALTQTVKDMEIDSSRKDEALNEIQGILAEKNLEIERLKQGMEQLNRDLTDSYKEHLRNMEKCLHDKEDEYKQLLAQKEELEDSKRKLVSANEDIYNQNKELISIKDELEKSVEDKERIIEQLSARLKEVASKESPEESEELKLKMKKLAANLKKKVQNEKDLLQQIKEYEEFLAEKEKLLEKLNKDLTEVSEKWVTEKSEKEQFKTELATILSAKSTVDAENADLKEKLKFLETEYSANIQKDEYKFQQMETQLQKMYENSERMKLKHEQDREKIAKLESEMGKASNEATKENEELKKMLAETCGKYEESKFKYEELNREKSQIDEKLCVLEAQIEQLKTENMCQQAKIQEQLAVIESLETDSAQTRDQLRRSEEQLSFLEERRSSLESKTEEMLKHIEEDSKNAVLLDDMSSQIQALAQTEQNLRSTVKSLDEKNRELEMEIKELTADKSLSEKELSELRQKLSNAHEELKRLRELDGEKSEVLELLTAETEKLKSMKMEMKQKAVDIENLHKDIDLLEADLKENVENSKTVEKLLNHKIEELMQENAALTEKIKDLSETKESQDDKKPVKRKKSVTFRTDETDYIQDLKSKIHEYSEAVKKSEEEIADLKLELLREKLRNEVEEVVSEAKEKVESLKSTPEKTEKKFDASAFFGKDVVPEKNPFFDQQADSLEISNQDQNADYDSLMWDDGWGTDGHLEEQYLSTQTIAPSQEKYDLLEKELKMVEGDKQKIEEELQQLQVKYAKAIKKMKEQKTAYDKLQNEVNRLKSDAEFGGLDGAIIDELKSQISAYEQREKELVKSLEASKTEKEGLLKRIDVLNAGNEKLVEMKERQDETDRWESKNRQLLDEITELRNELRNKEKESSIDENDLVKELKNKIEGLEWENCDLKELLEEKQELLETQKVAMDSEKEDKLVKDVEQLNSVKEDLERRLADEQKRSREVIGDLEQQMAALASENETLQEILNEMKKSDKSKTPEPAPTVSSNESETKVFDYFKTAPVNDLFSSVTALPVSNEPVVEPIIERKVTTEVFASNDQLDRELENLKQENHLLQQELSEAQSVITTIKTERHEMAEKYRTEYESALSFHLEEKNNALQKVYELEQALATKIEELNNISTKMKDLDQAINLKSEELNAVKNEHQKLQQALLKKTEDSSNYFNKVKESDQKLNAKDGEIDNLKAALKEYEVALQGKSNELMNKLQTLQIVEDKLRIREEEGYKILQELAMKVDEVKTLSWRVKELEEECTRKTAALENLEKTNDELLRNVEESSPEVESLSRLLSAERSAIKELQRSIAEKEDIINVQSEEVKLFKDALNENEEKVKKLTLECEKQKTLAEENCNAREKLEDVVSSLRVELETVNKELELSRKELEELRKTKEEEIAQLETKIEAANKAESEIQALREEMLAKCESYEKELSDKESVYNEEIRKIQEASRAMEDHMETLKSELKDKDNDIFELGQTLDEEQKQLEEVRALLEAKDVEIADLKQALNNFQVEISSFRNFEKQVKELRLAQMGSNVSVTAEGDPDFTNWTEHELAELNTRLQSDLDTALYMLHQRDIRCDELTFELMQLLEERDTLQLRLSTVIRINEELRSLTSNDKVTYIHDTRQESKDLVDQSNDRQGEAAIKVPEEDLQQLAQKISQLHSVGYIKDKTIQDETLRRHRDQMSLLGRVSDGDLGRDSPSSAAATNWIRTGKTAPKIMHV